MNSSRRPEAGKDVDVSGDTTESTQTIRVRSDRGRRHRRPLKTILLVVLVAGLVGGIWNWRRIVIYAYCSQAERLADQVRLAESLDAARKAAAFGPDDAAALLLLARIERQNGLSQESLLTLDRIPQGRVAVVRLQRERILSQVRLGRLEFGESILPDLLASDDLDGRDVCEAFVFGFRSRFRLEEASTLLDAWEADWPKDYRPPSHRGILEQMIANSQSAAQEYAKALELGDPAPGTLVKLGRCQLQLNTVKEAHASFQTCVSRHPEHSEGWLGLGDALSVLGKSDEAVKAYEKCLVLDSHCFEARLALARLTLEYGNAETAEKMLEELNRLWPEDAATLYHLSRALIAVGKQQDGDRVAVRWQAADSQVEEMERLIVDLQKDPGNATLRTRVGGMMMRLFSRPMAVQFLEASLLQNSNDADARRVLAEYFRKTGQPERAAAHENWLNQNSDQR